MSHIKLSVIIPARSEYPQIIFTIYSVLHAWETSYKALGWTQDQIEIIIVNNCSTDREYPRTALKGTTEYLMPRGMFSNRYLRVVNAPIAGNHSARNRGVERARGEYIFLSDAHMAYNPRYFEYMIKAVQESGGIVHSPIGWLGAYPPKPESLGYQYTIKLGEEWKGCVDEETEILTKKGWKKWNEVDMETEFLTVQRKQSKTLEWQKPREIVVRDHDGEMIHLKGNCYDALLTPYHRTFYQSPELRKQIKAGNRGENEWKVKSAENIKDTDYLPVSTNGIPDRISILNDDMVPLIGWIITEGCYNKDGSITIVQEKEQHRVTIQRLLDNLGLSYCIKGGRGDFKIHQTDGKTIRKILPEKYLSLDFLLLLDKKQLHLLKDALIDGDGTRQKNSENFFQKEEETINNFQILNILLGNQTKTKLREFKESDRHFGGPMYNSYVQTSDFVTTDVEKVQYKGKVWCPDLPNGSVFIRRYGQTMVTGNTWAQRCLSTDDWFYIPALGHCSLAFRRDQFVKFRGYQEHHRTYGGGEMYVNMLWWMMGSTVVCEPRAIGYHLASERGYTYNHDDYIGNIFACMYALGIDDWRERTYINYLRKGKKSVLDKLMARGEKEQHERRLFVEKYRKHTFNQIIVDQPWNKLNQKKFGKSNGGLSIFFPTWLPLLENTPAKEAYENSKYQVELAKFIKNELWDFVYRGDQFNKDDY